MRKLLLTIDINNFQTQNSIDSMKSAAERWGADFLAYDKDLMNGQFGLTFNKMYLDKISEGYDQIAYFDADCIIRSDAPTPYTLIIDEKIRAVQNGNERIGNYQNTLNQHLTNLLKINKEHQMLELITDVHLYFNTGFILGNKSSFNRLCSMVRSILPELPFDKHNAIYEQALFNYAARCLSQNMNDYFCIFAEECWNYMYPHHTDYQSEWVYHISNDVNDRNKILQNLNWRLS